MKITKFEKVDDRNSFDRGVRKIKKFLNVFPKIRKFFKNVPTNSRIKSKYLKHCLNTCRNDWVHRPKIFETSTVEAPKKKNFKQSSRIFFHFFVGSGFRNFVRFWTPKKMEVGAYGSSIMQNNLRHHIILKKWKRKLYHCNRLIISLEKRKFCVLNRAYLQTQLKICY